MIKRTTSYWPLVMEIYFFQTISSCLWFSLVADFGKMLVLRDFPGYVVVFSLIFFLSYCQQVIRVILILVWGVCQILEFFFGFLCLMWVKIFGIVILVFVKVLVQVKVSGMMTRFVVEKLTLVLAVRTAEWLNVTYIKKTAI